jgi:hypothetical protein
MSEAIKEAQALQTLADVNRAAVQEFWNMVIRYEDTPSNFIRFVERMDERMGSTGASYLEAIRLAISSEFIGVARELASTGAERRPNNQELQNTWRVIRPPEVISVNTGRLDPHQGDNWRWLRENTEKFWGKWVAIRAGELVSSADTFAGLKERLGGVITSDLLITRVIV